MGCNLRGVILSGLKFRRLKFATGRLIKRQTFIDKADFGGANLEHAGLTDVYLSRADFTNANLRAANLAGSLLKDPIFCNTTMPDGSTNDSGCIR